ncbi:nitric oxide-associated protein 1-like [Asterias amurensis]|uniref:nitric oxide-associated protein 1-like n=1 Tax=Asterias amurensis TaxID=7602 RepID=UPI003AB2979D
MIRCPLRSRWLPASLLNVNQSGRQCALSHCPGLSGKHPVHQSCVHAPRMRLNWAPLCTMDNPSPPTHSRQGQMKSSKRSLTNLSSGTCLLPWIKPVPLHSVNNYQAANFVSDASSNSGKKALRIGKSKVGQLLASNPMTRGKPKEGRLRERSTIRPQFTQENEKDEIDIHSPEGALQDSLPTEDELHQMLYLRNSKDAPTKLHKKESHRSVDDVKEMNAFDEQYFQNVANYENQSMVDQSSLPVKHTSCDETSKDNTNEFDRQYFGSVQDQVHFSKETRNGPKKSTPVYIDTNSAENHIDNHAYSAKTKEAMKLFDKKLGTLFESNSNKSENINLRSLFEPHETSTTFKRIEDDQDDHKEVSFEMETSFEDTSPEMILSNRPLKAKLEAERKFMESKEEFRIGDHNFADLEPEIIKALKTAWESKTKRVVRRKKEKNKIFGTPDPNLPSTNVPCSGCGAIFQGHDAKQPGFMPSEKFKELLDKNGLERAVCQRCWLMTHREMAPDVSIREDDYRDIISSIRKKEALVLVLVDMLDFPCSLIPNLKELVGEGKPMVIVGNKADLLPKDSEDCYQRMRTQLLQACVDAGVCNGDSVKHVALISAKSGFGIEDLITALQKKWGSLGDVYLIGTTNVGKSTLFNHLLKSDYCKAKASWLISKATISRWPGTTLNLLRFPVVRPTAEKEALRQTRLQAERKQAKAKEELNKKQRKRDVGKLDEEAYVRGSVGRSYDINVQKDEMELDDSDPFSITVGNVSSSSSSSQLAPKIIKEKLPFSFRDEEFDLGRWFYDTPGLINDQQILTKLTSEELKAVVPKKVLLPKTVVILPGNTIFIGGMGRLDYLEGHKAAFFTVFTSKALPVSLVSTDKADEQYQHWLENGRLKVPLGGKERLKTLPPLQPMEMTVHGVGWDCSAADVLFSSVGWAAVTAADGMEVKLRVYTPGGLGCILRRPALLPYVVNLRGKRHAKTPFFRVDREKLLRYL